MGTDNNGYLLGIHAFVKAGDQYLRPSTLSAASFWVGLRQEIYSAVMNHKPVRINLDNSLVDRSFGPADDYTWANRAVVHCADALNFCFGTDPQSFVARWSELYEWNKKWHEAVPSSFVPIYQKEGTDDAFPEFWHQSGCQGTSSLFSSITPQLIVRLLTPARHHSHRYTASSSSRAASYLL